MSGATLSFVVPLPSNMRGNVSLKIGGSDMERLSISYIDLEKWVQDLGLNVLNVILLKMGWKVGQDNDN